MSTPIISPSIVPSLIRTYVPLAVGWVVAWVSTLGINVSDTARAALVGIIGTVAAGGYYALVRVLERRWPFLSVLLGSKVRPVYPSAGPKG